MASSKQDQSVAAPVKQVKISQSDVPAATLEAALRLAQGLYDQFAGKDAAPHDVAFAIDVSPTSSAWRTLSGAAVAYGITVGASNASSIALTDLGRRIVAPVEEGDDEAAKIEAMLKPRVLRDFFGKYDRAKFPRDDIAKNVLSSMGVPKERLERAFEIIKENGRATGVIRDTRTGPFVALAPSSRAPIADAEVVADAEIGLGETPEQRQDHPVALLPTALTSTVPSGPKQIFVAHGKNHKPLEELKKILDQFKIPYKVAVDEPNMGRPISKKVAQLMRECSAGIFVFTGDEAFLDKDSNEVWRPSENVVYELGAASVLWETKIIILKQKDVTFPSDFKDLGYIEFEEGQLSMHALDLLKELIGLEFIKVQPA